MTKLDAFNRGLLLLLSSSMVLLLASFHSNNIVGVVAVTGRTLIHSSSRRRNLSRPFKSVHFTSVKAVAKTATVRKSGTTSGGGVSDSSTRRATTKKAKPNVTVEEEAEGEEEEDQLGYDSLGPIGKTIAGAVEVGVVAASSYISGGIFGYVVGGAMGIPILFRPLPSAANTNSALKQFASKLKMMNEKAVHAGKNWGQISASFSGFHALCRVARGGREDKWNFIIGSGAAGAFQSRSGTFLFLFYILVYYPVLDCIRC
jgi:hypothetical protein